MAAAEERIELLFEEILNTGVLNEMELLDEQEEHGTLQQRDVEEERIKGGGMKQG